MGMIGHGTQGDQQSVNTEAQKHRNTKKGKLGVKGRGTEEISNQQAKTEAKKAKSGNDDSRQGTQYGDQRRHT